MSGCWGVLCGLLLGVSVAVSAQTVVSPTDPVSWLQQAATLSSAESYRISAYANANADKVIANVNDGTAVGSVLAFTCASTPVTQVFQCVSSTTMQGLVGTSTPGTYSVALVSEARNANGTYAARTLFESCGITLPVPPPPPSTPPPPPPPPPTGLPTGAVSIATENQTATFTGTQTVYYGASSTFVSAAFTSSVLCANTTFGSDPLPGIVKACYAVAAAPPPVTPPPPVPPSPLPTNATRIAGEGETVSVVGTPTVYYGANGLFTSLAFTGSVACTNAAFGTDPAPSVLKSCYAVLITPPTPVNCVVSAFGPFSSWAPINATTEQRVRTRTIDTPPSDGGTACPSLSDAETRLIVIVPPPPAPDTTAPTASLTAPIAGATVSGAAVLLTATAADSVGVVTVDFTLDGATLLVSDTASPYQYTWDTTAVADGAHTLVALAHDGAGNLGASTVVSFAVNNLVVDSTAPSVSVSSPAAGATVAGTVTVMAAATDNVGVTSVQFTLDGVNLGLADTTAPYTVSWNTVGVSNTTHTLRAVAIDAAANTTTSALLNVNVNNVVAPPPAQPVITATMAVRTCTLTMAANQTPDGTVGWTVRFRRNGLSHGSRDSSSPYSQAAQVNVGSYILTAEWTKGQVISRVTVGTYVCPTP